MGITIVSSASLSPSGNPAGAQAPADSGALDFSALLIQQMSGPQLTMQLQAATEGGTNDSDPRGDGTDVLQDPASALAAAGLLPAFMANPNLPQPADAARPGRFDNAAGQGQIAGIVGQIDLNASQGRSAEAGMTEALNSAQGLTGEAATSLAGNALGTDTANLAADSEAASGNNQNFAATLAAQSGTAQQAQAHKENAVPATQVATPLHDGRWAQDFSEKVVWLAKNDQQVAQIAINPPQLGPLHITLNLSGDQASALFVSPHAEVRQAIEDAMPRLREVLAGAGIDLGQANVGTQLPQQNSAQPQFSSPSRSGGDNAILRADSEQGATTPLAAVRGGRGMVDLFA